MNQDSNIGQNIKIEVDKAVDVLKVHRRYIYIIVAIACLFAIQECRHQRSEDKLVSDIANYKDTAKYFKNKHGDLVAYNKTLEFNSEKQLKAYLAADASFKEMMKKMKNVVVAAKVTQTITIHDTIPIQYESVIPCDFNPFTVKRDCTHYHFRGTIYRDKFTIDSIGIPNVQKIVVGDKKVNLFKREQQITIVNSNPYVQTQSIGAYTIKYEKKWYERPIVQFGAGFLVGYGLSEVRQVIAK